MALPVAWFSTGERVRGGVARVKRSFVQIQYRGGMGAGQSWRRREARPNVEKAYGLDQHEQTPGWTTWRERPRLRHACAKLGRRIYCAHHKEFLGIFTPVIVREDAG